MSQDGPVNRQSQRSDPDAQIAAYLHRLLYRLRPWGWRFYHSGYGYADGRAWTKRGAKLAQYEAAKELGYFG